MEYIEQLKEQVSTYVNKKNIIIYIVLLCIGLFLGWYVFGRTDIHDNGSTISTANEQLDRVRENQQDTARELESIRNRLNESIDRITEAEGTVSRIEESANDIRETNRESNDLARESEQRIRESIKILEEIRGTEK